MGKKNPANTLRVFLLVEYLRWILRAIETRSLKLNAGTLTSFSIRLGTTSPNETHSEGKKICYEAPEKVRGRTQKKASPWIMNAAFISSPQTPPLPPTLPMHRFCPSHIKLKEPAGCGANGDSSHAPACDRLCDTTVCYYIGASARTGFNSHPRKLALEVILYWAEPEVIQRAEWELNELRETGRFFYYHYKYIAGFLWIESNSTLPCGAFQTADEFANLLFSAV